MGFNHQEISEKILAKWNFPPVLQAIVRNYADPQHAPAEYKTEVSIVHIANTLSLMAGIGIGSDGLYHELDSSAIQAAGLSEQDVENIFAKIPDVLTQMKDIL